MADRQSCPELVEGGSCYTARDTRAFARDIGLVPRTTPVSSPQSNGMAEAFVRTLKRDYVRVSPRPDTQAYMKGVTLDFSRRGKPTDNAFIESFNDKFRAECLNAHWFMSLDDAVRKCEAWRRDYNEVRPHSAIGNKPPISLLSASLAHDPL